MRRALIAILLAAAAATPAMALAQDGDSRAEARAARVQERYRAAGERNQQRVDRQQARSERQEARQETRAQRQEVRQEARIQRQETVQAPVQQQQSQGYVRRGGVDGRRSQRWSGGDNSASREAYRSQIEATRQASRRSADQTVDGHYARQGLRNQQRVDRDRREDRRGSWNGDRDGRQRYGDRRDSRRSSWNHTWRNDRRYDWQRYRYSNRSLFRLGGYYSPYRNYRYNRLSIGIVLDSLFYSNRYWLSDPWQYRLPPAPYGTQWVRYYDDVVLVDVYTGEVIDVIYDFFW